MLWIPKWLVALLVGFLAGRAYQGFKTQTAPPRVLTHD